MKRAKQPSRGNSQYVRRESNPYHPETCPPNCPRCEAQRGADESIKLDLQQLKVRNQTKEINRRNGAHLIACAVYDKPQGACNCGKVNR